MLFVNEEYENYKYLVEANDNYIVLTNRSYVAGAYDNQVEYKVIYQYLKPSILTIEDTRVARTEINFDKIETSQNYWDRADCPELICASFTIIWFLLFIINALTRFVRKGGVFFGQ